MTWAIVGIVLMAGFYIASLEMRPVPKTGNQENSE